MLTKASLECLARFRAYQPPPTKYFSLPLSRRSAVLIVLYPDAKGDLRVILTVRTRSLRSFSGDAALPGGKSETGESPFETARREAYEEIGLPQENSRLPGSYELEHLTQLPTSLSKNLLGVRPCVAFLSARGEEVERLIPNLNPKEVDAIFTAPFGGFLETRTDWYQGTWVKSWNGQKWKMHQFAVASRSHPGLTHTVWGLTARILVDAARIGYGRDPDFSHLEGVWHFSAQY